MINIDIREKPVFWINLNDAVDRRSSMERMFDKYGFKNVTRIEGVRHPIGKIGCGKAFLRAFEQAPDEDFIILEDDCVETKMFRPIISLPEDTDGLYLGISMWGLTEEGSGPNIRLDVVDESTFRIYNMLSAHAIYYRTKEFVKLCRDTVDHWTHIKEDHHDMGYAENMENNKVYCMAKPIFYQTSSEQVTNVMIERLPNAN